MKVKALGGEVFDQGEHFRVDIMAWESGVGSRESGVGSH
jgi:hypothetical protein